MDDFGVLILSHGRPDRQITLKSLHRHGYTGPIRIVVDNEDETLADYQRLFGDMIIVFDKREWQGRFDVGDNFPDRRSVVYARNAAWQIARDLGWQYFVELDDDYSHFSYKFTPELDYHEVMVEDLDILFAECLRFFRRVPALRALALAQNGDFIGGGKNTLNASRIRLGRKMMNVYFLSTDRPFQFVGRLNDDVNTYVTMNNRGELVLTIYQAAICQRTTQANKGGLTDLYLDMGTYVKSFYSVMFAPSCVKVADMGDKHRRIHHRVDWAHAAPMILSESVRKVGGIGEGVDGSAALDERAGS